MPGKTKKTSVEKGKDRNEELTGYVSGSFSVANTIAHSASVDSAKLSEFLGLIDDEAGQIARNWTAHFTKKRTATTR